MGKACDEGSSRCDSDGSIRWGTYNECHNISGTSGDSAAFE